MAADPDLRDRCSKCGAAIEPTWGLARCNPCAIGTPAPLVLAYAHGCSVAHDPGMKCRHGLACADCMTDWRWKRCEPTEDPEEVQAEQDREYGAAIRPLVEALRQKPWDVRAKALAALFAAHEKHGGGR